MWPPTGVGLAISLASSDTSQGRGHCVSQRSHLLDKISQDKRKKEKKKKEKKKEKKRKRLLFILFLFQTLSDLWISLKSSELAKIYKENKN